MKDDIPRSSASAKGTVAFVRRAIGRVTRRERFHQSKDGPPPEGAVDTQRGEREVSADAVRTEVMAVAESQHAEVMRRIEAVEATLASAIEAQTALRTLAGDVRALGAEVEIRASSLRTELHAFAGSLHADTVARLGAVHARLESDLAALLRFRRTPDSELESELTDSMRTVIENATAEIRQALLDRSDLNMRVLEQELVRVTSRLESRLDEIGSECTRLAEASTHPSRVPLAPER